MKASTELAVVPLVCSLTSIGMIGCNTFRRAGKDIQSGGHAVERAADRTQDRDDRPNTITAWAEPGGSISPSGNTSTSYWSSRTFTIRANRGYHVADVLVDGNSVGAVSRYTFENAAERHTISAVFAAGPRR